jgi:hypothetical protein
VIRDRHVLVLRIDRKFLFFVGCDFGDLGREHEKLSGCGFVVVVLSELLAAEQVCRLRAAMLKNGVSKLCSFSVGV